MIELSALCIWWPKVLYKARASHMYMCMLTVGVVHWEPDTCSHMYIAKGATAMRQSQLCCPVIVRWSKRSFSLRTLLTWDLCCVAVSF